MARHWSRIHKERKRGFAEYSLVKPKEYLSFLLRLWRVKQNDENGWRASLENPHTGEVRGFASLEALWNFLREETQRMGEEKIHDDR
jgi:hypothetical protein